MKFFFFIEIFDSNLTFLRGLWRSLKPPCCLLRVYYWLKCDHKSVLQSLGDAKHVHIGSKNIKKFCWKKNFHRNFWLKFDISHGANMRKADCVPTLNVKKKNLRHLNKNPLPQFCRAWSGAQIKYPQHGHISWIEGYKKIKVKKIKISYLSALLK